MLHVSTKIELPYALLNFYLCLYQEPLLVLFVVLANLTDD